MKKMLIGVALVAIFAIAISSVAFAQTDMATLQVFAGEVELRQDNQTDYQLISNNTVQLQEGTNLRWESSASGSIEFFNGLAIPVNGISSPTPAEITLTDSTSGVAISQTSGRVLYSLQNAPSQVYIEDTQGGAEVNLSQGAVQITQSEALEATGIQSSLTWNIGSVGSLQARTFFVDFSNELDCYYSFAPQVDIYNLGSATAPTQIGVSGSVQFSTIDPDRVTEIFLSDSKKLVIDGIATVNICGQENWNLSIEVVESSEPILIANVDTGSPITTAVNNEITVFGPGSGTPFQLPSGIGTTPPTITSTACIAGETVVVDGEAFINADSTGCETDVERGNPEWEALAIGEETCPEFLVYSTDETSNLELFRLGEVEEDPVAVRNISNGGLNTVNVETATSPDSQYIAFTSNRDGNYEIYVASIDGQFIQRATVNNFAVDIDPVWSPTGDVLAYMSNVDGNWEIRELDLITGVSRSITENRANDVNPTFSPDGQSLYFASDRPFTNNSGVTVLGQWQIYEFNRFSGVLTRISDGEANDTSPRVSPDGSLIAFTSDRDSDTNNAIFIMDLDGENVERISAEDGDAFNYTWSADGSRIGYNLELNDGTPSDVYIYDFNEELNIQVTDSSGELRSAIDTEPTFLCFSDSEMVVTSDVDGDYDLYMITIPLADEDPLDMTLQNNLTDNTFSDRSSVNSPKESDTNATSLLPPSFQG